MVPFSLTRPVRRQAADLNLLYRDVGDAVARLTKTGAAVKTHALSGELYASSSGWMLLAVPNALVRGAFDALDENGAQLPLRDGKLNAHCSVFRPEEVDQIGGIDKITERGHHFHYTLGPIKEVQPAGWDEMSRVWFIEIESPELQELRKSYGLSALPKDGKHPFHVTIAVRKKHVLRSNEVSKTAEAERLLASERARYAGAQQLAGYGREVREQGPQPVQGLRGPGDLDLSKVAGQLRCVLGGHGSSAGGDDVGTPEERSGLRPGQLLLGDQGRAEPQQEKQSADHSRRPDADAVRVVEGDRAGSLRHPEPDREAGLGRGPGRVDASLFDSLRSSPAHVDRSNTDAGGLVKGAGVVGRDDTSAAASRLVGGTGSVDPVDSGSEGLFAVLKIGHEEKRGPAAEYCPHCDARLERDPDSGTCNRCGKDWSQKEAAYGGRDKDPRWGCQCPMCGGTKTSGARATQHYPDGTWGPANAVCGDCGDGFSFNYDTMKPEKRETGPRGEKSAAMIPHGGTVSYDYHCRPCDHSFDEDGNGGKCPLCGGDRAWTTTNPKRMKTAGEILAGLLGGRL